MRRLLIAIGAIALVAVVVIGLSQSAGDNGKPKATGLSVAEMQRRLAGAPEPLAALHRDASRIIPGGKAVFEKRLRALHGYPIVVNLWAAWCGPCRAEFPVFQAQGVAFGRRVAFLAVDSEDNRGDATKFLRSFPVPYPSYEDPSARVARDLKVAGYPDTVFYDASGKQTYLHQGPYRNEAALASDIRRYALERR